MNAVLLSVILIGTLFILFYWYQRFCAYEILIGYWYISDNYYMLISESDGTHEIEFIELINGSDYRSIYKEITDISYRSIVPFTVHDFSMKLKNKSNPFKAKSVKLCVYPTVGMIQVMSANKEIVRMTKDNIMTATYLSIA